MPLAELDEEPYDEVPLVPLVVPVVPAEVPVPAPLVVADEPPMVPLELAGCALVSIQLPDIDDDDAVVPLVAVPVVPVVLAPAGCRQPTTVTVPDVLLAVGELWLVELPVCAYAATAAPMTSANDAPQMLRFMRASFARRQVQWRRRAATRETFVNVPLSPARRVVIHSRPS